MGAPSHQEPDLLNILAAEHEGMNHLFAQLKDKGSDRERLFTKLTNELEMHSALEERLVYPILEGVSAATHTKARRAVQDHKAVATLLKEITKVDFADPEFDRLLLELEKNVKRHVREEEEELFPMIRQNTTSEELRRRGVTFMHTKQSLKLPPLDTTAARAPQTTM